MLMHFFCPSTPFSTLMARLICLEFNDITVQWKINNGILLTESEQTLNEEQWGGILDSRVGKSGKLATKGKYCAFPYLTDRCAHCRWNNVASVMKDAVFAVISSSVLLYCQVKFLGESICESRTRPRHCAVLCCNWPDLLCFCVTRLWPSIVLLINLKLTGVTSLSQWQPCSQY